MKIAIVSCTKIKFNYLSRLVKQLGKINRLGGYIFQFYDKILGYTDVNKFER